MNSISPTPPSVNKKLHEKLYTVGEGILNRTGNKDTDMNSKLFLGNSLLTTLCAGFFFRNSPDDLVAKQSVGQDVIVNGKILLDSVENPTNLFIKSVSETTIFAGLVGTILPIITEHYKSTPVDMACAVALPFVAGKAGDIANDIANKFFLQSNEDEKSEEQSSLTPQEQVIETKKLRKTYGAVALAAIAKAGILGYNIMQGKGHTSNALFGASLFNTIKTGFDTQASYRKGEKIRDAKDVIGILFDGVVSPIMSLGILGMGQYIGLPNTLSNTIGKAVVGGIGASGALKGITHGIDIGLDHMLGYNNNK